MVIIFDRAHGKDVAGKKSPDSRLIEWKWSQAFITLVMAKLSNCNLKVLCPFIHLDTEPGLSKRVETYNELVAKHGDCLMISPHVNAAGEGWEERASGFEIWTSPGQDESDPIADVFLNEIARVFPGEKIRKDLTDGDQDKEAKFTVLYGNGVLKPKYKAVLVENLFMTCHADVDKLLDEKFNDTLADAYINAIFRILNYK